MSVLPDPAAPLAGAAPVPAAARVAPPAAAVLGNGAYSVRVTGAGTGLSTFGAHALTRWGGDPVADGDGFLVWLADRERGALWSVAAVPCAPVDSPARARFEAGAVEFARLEHGLDARLAVAVHPALPLEIRRVTLSHDGPRPRTIEVAAALEVVLHDRDADASHPAFSRLFVQTEWSAADGALLARRRPRGHGETFPWMALALLEDRAVEFESDRARFLGRVPDRARPRGLDSAAPWSGTAGNVLDPVLALRVTRTIQPGVPVTLTFALVAGADRAAVLDALGRARGEGGASILAAARSRGEARHDAIEFAPAPARPAASAATAERDRAVAAALEREFAAEPLEFWNGSGGFAADGREYVIRFGGALDGTPPAAAVDQRAGQRGLRRPRERDRRRRHVERQQPRAPAHAVVQRPRCSTRTARRCGCATTTTARSPRRCPARPPSARDPYEVRHGFGVTRFRRAALGLDCRAAVFVARHDPVKLMRLSRDEPGRDAAAPDARARTSSSSSAGLPTQPAGGVITEAAPDGRALYRPPPRRPAVRRAGDVRRADRRRRGRADALHLRPRRVPRRPGRGPRRAARARRPGRLRRPRRRRRRSVLRPGDVADAGAGRERGVDDRCSATPPTARRRRAAGALPRARRGRAGAGRGDPLLERPRRRRAR